MPTKLFRENLISSLNDDALEDLVKIQKRFVNSFTSDLIPESVKKMQNKQCNVNRLRAKFSLLQTIRSSNMMVEKIKNNHLNLNRGEFLFELNTKDKDDKKEK